MLIVLTGLIGCGCNLNIALSAARRLLFGMTQKVSKKL